MWSLTCSKFGTADLAQPRKHSPDPLPRERVGSGHDTTLTLAYSSGEDPSYYDLINVLFLELLSHLFDLCTMIIDC